MNNNKKKKKKLSNKTSSGVTCNFAESQVACAACEFKKQWF